MGTKVLTQEPWMPGTSCADFALGGHNTCYATKPRENLLHIGAARWALWLGERGQGNTDLTPPCASPRLLPGPQPSPPTSSQLYFTG